MPVTPGVFEIASKYCISDSFDDYDGYSSSSKGFLPKVVDVMVILVKFTHSSPFEFADSQNVDVHSCCILFDHFQFALIHGPNIYFCFTDYAKDFDRVNHNKLWKILKKMGIPDHLTCSWETYMQVRKQQLELDMEQQTDSK